MFQSLSGFLMRCDLPGALRGRVHEKRFQSLSGFLMRCDLDEQVTAGEFSTVSIPIGFSDAL